MSEFTEAKMRLIGIYGTNREGRIYYPAQQCLDKMQHEYDQQADRSAVLEKELAKHRRYALAWQTTVPALYNELSANPEELADWLETLDIILQQLEQGIDITARPQASDMSYEELFEGVAEAEGSDDDE